MLLYATNVIYKYILKKILNNLMNLNFNDFQKQEVKFDINELQKAYKSSRNKRF